MPHCICTDPKRPHLGEVHLLSYSKHKVNKIIIFVPCQRQKLREIILQQQQQKKNAARQEKTPPQTVPTPHTAPVQQWQQENMGQVFNRPPPPYPGNVRSSMVPPGGLRFPGFAVDGQFSRPQFPGDLGSMGVRPHGIRYVS